RSADARVLKAQLDLVAEAMALTRFSAVVWSLILVGMASPFLGVVGNVPLSRSIWLPIAVALTSLIATQLVARFKKDSSIHSTQECISLWQHRVVYMQTAIGVVWGFAPWLLWQDGSPENHLFLAGAMVVVSANLVVSRANHASVVLAGLIPAATIAA